MGDDFKVRKSELKFNLEEVKDKLPKRTHLVAVSKFKPVSDIALMYELSQLDFGENKVQELKEKSEALSGSCPDINWHFIGNLQTNKINTLLKINQLTSIHSIDSIKLLNKLLSKNLDKKIGLFLQVNTSDEDEKSGFEDYQELVEGIKLIQEHDQFFFQGLMTMGKIRTDNFTEDAKACFLKLTNIKDKLENEKHGKDIKLSMGMSQDFEIAVKVGTDYIRVGSKLFGERV
jgi:pyridoxal phosphate enzyme (YggS family)